MNQLATSNLSLPLEEDMEIDFAQLANDLAELSEPGPLPQGVAAPKDVASFTATEVDFESNHWLQRVTDVQHWLCLDQPLEGVAPARAAAQLFAELVPDGDRKCFSEADGVVRLTPFGVEKLEERLARATSTRLAFLEALEDDRALKDASSDWKAAWDDPTAVAQISGAIIAKVDTWKIKEFKDLAAEDQIDLNPSYQRDVVWSKGESQKLISSILRGIPLPSVILSQVEDGQGYQIVDGKQRLTALLRFIGRHPDARRHARQLEGGEELFDKNFREFAGKTKNHLTPANINECFFPFQLERFDANDRLYSLSGKYYCEILDKSVQIGDVTIKIRALFESVTSNYLIPVIVYYKTRIQDIHKVFGLYNRQGRKLNAEELRNAAYHHLDLTKLLLVLSGDRSNEDHSGGDRPNSALLPYLQGDLAQGAEETGERLKDLGFGTARFKRTKVLAWTSAILLHPPGKPGKDVLVTPSTSGHINSLLDAMNDQGARHALTNRTTLLRLCADLQSAIQLHRSNDDAWDHRFKRKQTKQAVSSRWEELPVVASLLALTVLVAIGEGERFSLNVERVRELTAKLPGPSKSQNRTQWAHIAKVVVEVLGVLEIELDKADTILQQRYGYSCLGTLRQLSLIAD